MGFFNIVLTGILVLYFPLFFLFKVPSSYFLIACVFYVLLIIFFYEFGRGSLDPTDEQTSNQKESIKEDPNRDRIKNYEFDLKGRGIIYENIRRDIYPTDIPLYLPKNNLAKEDRSSFQRNFRPSDESLLNRSFADPYNLNRNHNETRREGGFSYRPGRKIYAQRKRDRAQRNFDKGTPKPFQTSYVENNECLINHRYVDSYKPRKDNQTREDEDSRKILEKNIEKGKNVKKSKIIFERSIEAQGKNILNQPPGDVYNKDMSNGMVAKKRVNFNEKNFDQARWANAKIYEFSIQTLNYSLFFQIINCIENKTPKLIFTIDEWINPEYFFEQNFNERLKVNFSAVNLQIRTHNETLIRKRFDNSYECFMKYYYDDVKGRAFFNEKNFHEARFSKASIYEIEIKRLSYTIFQNIFNWIENKSPKIIITTDEWIDSQNFDEPYYRELFREKFARLNLRIVNKQKKNFSYSF